MLPVDGDFHSDKMVSHGYFLSKVWNFNCKLLAVLEVDLGYFLRNSGPRMREADLKSVNFGKVVTEHEQSEASASWLRCGFLGLLLSLPDLLLISLFDLLSRKVIWVLLNRLITLEKTVFLSLISKLSRVVKECDSLDFMVQELELFGTDPLLVV